MNKSYETYKDSGIDWIGKIPSHWEVKKLKHEISLKGRIGWKGLRFDEFQENSYAYLVTGQDFSESDIAWNKCYQIDKERYEEDPFIQLSNGDILVTKDGTIGKVAMVRGLDKPACLNSGIFVLKQKRKIFQQQFLYRLLCSHLLSEYNTYTQTGATILHLYQNVFDNMPLVLPPFSEQQAIAAYLDEKCGKVDSLVAELEQQVSDLSDLKKSEITRVVTKGLDPNAPLKESGLEWIGKIPSHWNVQPLKRICVMKTGGTPPDKKGINTDGVGYPWITAQDFDESMRIKNFSQYITSEAVDDCGYKLYPKGSVLLVCIASVGKIGLIDTPSYANQQITAIMPNEKMNSVYLLYMLNALSPKIVADASSNVVPIVNMSYLSTFSVIVPNLSEQQAIADYLDAYSSKIDATISEIKAQIADLKLYKQSLISEAVTGKIRVTD